MRIFRNKAIFIQNEINFRYRYYFCEYIHAMAINFYETDEENRRSEA